MDPISQGIVGSSFSQSCVRNKKSLLLISIIGFLSGIAPDVDIFIRSEEDPLLFLEFHRQFTHSLIFIPIGGIICASFFYCFYRIRAHISFKEVWFFSTIGYGTHGLLDACTSYGTLLFWPFSYERISWSNISIIDPFFTVPLIILVILGLYLKKIYFSRLAVIWALSYLLLGVILNEKALNIGKQLAEKRGHNITMINAKPTFANLFLWKIIYENKGIFYTDGIRIFPTIKIIEGDNIPKLDLSKDFLWLNPESQQAIDIRRFSWFSQNHLVISPKNKNLIVDVRYSILPNQISGLWGIELNPEAGFVEHAKFISNRNKSEDRIKVLINMIIDG
jgi:inner membrane protein